MAPHSSTLAWEIPWTEEPGGLQSMGLRRVGHDWESSLSLFTFMHWRRKWQPTPVFLPGESQGRGAWWAAAYGVAQSRTRLKRLSSGSSSSIPSRTLPLSSLPWFVMNLFIWLFLVCFPTKPDLNPHENRCQGILVWLITFLYSALCQHLARDLGFFPTTGLMNTRIMGSSLASMTPFSTTLSAPPHQ